MKTIFPPRHSRAVQRLLAVAAVAFIILVIVLQYGVYGLLVTSFFAGAVGSFFGGGGGHKRPTTTFDNSPFRLSDDVTDVDPIYKMYSHNIWHRSK